MTKNAIWVASAMLFLNTACTVSTSSPKVRPLPEVKEPVVVLPKNDSTGIPPDITSKATADLLADIFSKDAPMNGTVSGVAKVDGKVNLLVEYPKLSGEVECTSNGDPRFSKYKLPEYVQFAYKTSAGKRVNIRIEDPKLGSALFAYADSVQVTGEYTGSVESKTFEVAPKSGMVWMTEFQDVPVGEGMDCSLSLTPQKIQFKFANTDAEKAAGVKVNVKCETDKANSRLSNISLTMYCKVQ